jgi:hypothetical protein
VVEVEDTDVEIEDDVVVEANIFIVLNSGTIGFHFGNKHTSAAVSILATVRFCNTPKKTLFCLNHQISNNPCLALPKRIQRINHTIALIPLLQSIASNILA